MLEKARQALEGQQEASEIAFFGGSFTAVPEAYQKALLDAAYPFVKRGDFSGIRISTRPDAIDHTVLDLLKQYGVKTIELGAQSMDDRILALNQRGHTVQDVVNASRMIREYGFSLGLQMMTGLYGSTPESDWETGEKLVLCKPNCVRIYPTVVLRGTKLAEYYRSGLYSPPDTEQSIPLCARLLGLFRENGIEVIRLGLHDTLELKRDLLAGAYHPAFREKCQSYLFYKKILARVAEMGKKSDSIEIFGNPRELSQVVGQKRENIQKLKEQGIVARAIPDPSVPMGEIQVKCR